MSTLDIQKLLEPVSDDAPCGENLSEDFEYSALISEAQSILDLSRGGEAINREEESRRWRDVAAQCAALLGRSKDVWLAFYLTLAELRRRDFAGMRDGLRLLQGLVERYWEPLHPQRDPEDEYPIQRVNALGELSETDFLRALRTVEVCQYRGEACRMRDLLAAKNLLPGAEITVDATGLRAAFANLRTTDPGKADELTAAVRESLEAVRAIRETVAERVGTGSALNLAGLEQALAVALEFATPDAPVVPDGTGANGNGAAATGAMAFAGGGTPAVDGAIRSRNDVKAALDRISEFYKLNIPESPIPLMLARVRRWVDLDFLALMQDIAPGVTDDVKKLTGYAEDGNG